MDSDKSEVCGVCEPSKKNLGYIKCVIFLTSWMSIAFSRTRRPHSGSSLDARRLSVEDDIRRSPSLFYLLVHSRCRGCLFALDHT
jgi:hypothetical protein